MTQHNIHTAVPTKRRKSGKHSVSTDHFARELKAFRIEKDLTICELATLLAISKSTVHRVENGFRTNERIAFKIQSFLERVRRAA